MIATGNPELARSLNRALVLNALRGEDSASRSDLAHKLHLSKVTVSSIIDELITKGIVVENGIRDSSTRGGRKSILLSIDSVKKYVLGVDIGLTQISAAVCNLRGQEIAKVKRPTSKNHGQDSVISQVVAINESLLQEAGIRPHDVLGIGVAVGGIVESRKSLIRFSPGFGWHEANIADLLQKETHMKVAVDNNTRTMALGERWFGHAKGARNAFLVNVAYGLGSALIINNRIYDNFSEFGHLVVTDEKVRCVCGKFGCLEAVCSGRAIEEAARLAGMKKGGKTASAKDVAEWAFAGDERAKKLYVRAGTHLGRALSHVANLFSPEKIIISGGVLKAGDLLLAPLLKEFNRHTMAVIREKISIKRSDLPEATLKGAVSLALNRFVFRPELLDL